MLPLWHSRLRAQIAGNSICCQVRLCTKVVPFKAERQCLPYLELEDLVRVDEVVAEEVLRPRSVPS
jgi:hypothetical protein